MPPNDEAARWLDQPQNRTKVYWSVWIACFALLLVEPLIHMHAEVPVAEWFGFNGLFGFVACIGLVVAAKAMRRLLMRPEDTYDS
jgi:hypothetical protein